MRKLIFAAAIVALLGPAATSTADAATICPKWACGSNATQVNGLSRNGMRFNGLGRNGWRTNGIETNGLQQRAASDSPVVNAVILPSGETIDLR